MSILVTGGAGFIGSHTVVELQDAGYDVVVVDNLSNSSEKSLERVSAITGKPVTFYKADILDREALEEIFAGKPAAVIREAQAPYLLEKRQGEFNIEDYYALPDTRRAELIDGVIDDMAAPSSIHQAILRKISKLLFNYIQQKQGKCMLFPAPLGPIIKANSPSLMVKETPFSAFVPLE